MDAPIPYPLDYQQTLRRTIAVRLDNVTGDKRAELERALARLNQSDFGACEGCGMPIAFAAIAADPGARRCSTCAPAA